MGARPRPVVADLIRYRRSTTAGFLSVTPEAISREPEAPVTSQLNLADQVTTPALESILGVLRLLRASIFGWLGT